jgi:hypothetical protein
MEAPGSVYSGTGGCYFLLLFLASLPPTQAGWFEVWLGDDVAGTEHGLVDTDQGDNTVGVAVTVGVEENGLFGVKRNRRS